VVNNPIASIGADLDGTDVAGCSEIGFEDEIPEDIAT